MILNILSVMIATSLLKNVCSKIIYEVPEPKIEVFDNKGFRVSIPDGVGVELFAFHGQINEPMNGLEAGQFSKDILAKCGDLWVFEDKSTKVVVGNTIYYWLFVIRNRLGYRFDNGEFAVREVTSYTPLPCQQPLKNNLLHDLDWIFNDTEVKNLDHNPIFDVRSYEQPTGTLGLKRADKRDAEMSVCSEVLLNLSHRFVDVGKENQRLIEENRILTELAQREEYFAKTLKLFGKYPETYYATPKEFAQNLVLEKLLLHDVRVIDAKAIPLNGISFTVETLKDKIKIILAAKSGLMGSNFQLSW